MKKFISKIRNKRLKGNISLLVILILLASSVIALLSISQIQHLITYWDMTFNYFRAFYLAKAWTELGLTEVYNSENGFQPADIEHEENKDGSIDFDPIIAKNFLWDDNEYEWAKPYFNLKIVSNFPVLTNDIRHECNNDNKITLEPRDDTPGQEKPWGWIVLSLFKDNTNWLRNLYPDYDEKITKITKLEDSVIKSLTFWNPGWKFMFWLFVYDGENMDIFTKEWSDLNTFLDKNIWKIQWKRRYLTIKNIWDKPVSFCISWGWNIIPYSGYLVTVRGNYANMEVWLQSIAKKGIPSWSLNVLWWREP